jgi:nitroreductase
MEFFELVMKRRSIRSFLEKDVDNELLLKLIKAAQYAPSGGNCQPWHYFIIKDKGVIAQIIEKSCRQNWLSAAPVLIAVRADMKRSVERYGDRGKIYLNAARRLPPL